MKKYIFISLFVTILASVVTSCSSRLSIGENPNDNATTSHHGFESLKAEICNLDVHHTSSNFTRSIQYKRTPGDTIIHIVSEDVQGCLIGWNTAFGSIQKRIFTAALYGAYFSYRAYQGSVQLMSEAYMSSIQLQGLSNFKSLDLRQPINTLAPTTNNNNSIIANKVGAWHNHALMQLYNNGYFTPTTEFTSAKMALYNVIYNDASDYDIIQYSDFATNVEDAYSDRADTLFASLNNEFSEELEIIEHVHNVSLNLDSIAMINYIDAVTSTINNSYLSGTISENSAGLMNAAIYTQAYSRFLWKSYIPDYRLSPLYMAYIDDSEWVLCNQNQLGTLVNNYHVTHIGIPGVVNNKCTEIFFYPSSSYYNVNNPYYIQVSDNNYFRIYESDSFERMIPIYNNTFFEHMASGLYHVRSVPNENGITYVSFTDP